MIRSNAYVLVSLFVLGAVSDAQELSLNLGNRGTMANLVYDPGSGNVLLGGSETESGEIISFTLKSATGQSLVNLDSVTMPFEDTGRNTDLVAGQIGQFHDAAEVEGFVTHLLGPIFPTGMNMDQLTSFVDVGIYASEFGISGNFDAILFGTLPTGDFDGNGAADIDDVELVCSTIASSATATFMDLTGDSAVNGDDLAKRFSCKPNCCQVTSMVWVA